LRHLVTQKNIFKIFFKSRVTFYRFLYEVKKETKTLNYKHKMKNLFKFAIVAFAVVTFTACNEEATTETEATETEIVEETAVEEEVVVEETTTEVDTATVVE
jgi:large-conductance mechanosensitive channel